MGRPTTDEGASRATQSALLNLPNGANAKAKQHHCSIVVRKRIEYSNKFASCLRSRHLLDDDHQSCQQRITQNSNILSCLLFGLSSKTADGGKATRRLSKFRVRPMKPISAFYTDTFFTCTFLLIVTCAVVSLLMSFESASAAAAAAAAAATVENNLHRQHQRQHQHEHNHNEILHQSVYHHFDDHRHHHRHHERQQQQQQLHQQNGVRGKRQLTLSHSPRRHPVSNHNGYEGSERITEDRHLHKPLERSNSRLRMAPLAERNARNHNQFHQQHHPDHPQRLKLNHETRTKFDLPHRSHKLMRFRGFATPHRPTSFNLSEPNYALDSDNEFNSYNVDDVFKDDDEDHDDDADEDVEDSNEQPEDEDGEVDDAEDDDDDDDEDNEIDLNTEDPDAFHFNQPQRVLDYAQKHVVSRAKYLHRASHQPQHHPNSIELQHQSGSASRTVQANRRHHEQPKPRVPYQTPIVVSISDNSFVSASPVVLTTSSGGGSGNQQVVAAAAAGNSIDENRPDGEVAASDERELTTSTTATTTREAFAAHTLRGASNEQGLELLEDKVDGEPKSTRMTSTSAPIVLGNLNRYNYIVSDLERPRRPASEKQSRNSEQQRVKLGSSAALEIELPRTRSRTMQTSEPNVDLAPTVGTLSVIADDLNQVVDHLSESANNINSLTDNSDADEDDGDDNDDDDDEANDDDDEDRDEEQDDAGQEVEMDARFARATHQLDEFVRKSVDDGHSTSGKYANLIVNPRNELPGSYNRRHLASIRMIQEDPNEYQQGGALNGAIIAILSGVGVTGVLVLIVGVKMRSIRERLAHKSRRRSLVPDTDFLINTIPI